MHTFTYTAAPKKKKKGKTLKKKHAHRSYFYSESQTASFSLASHKLHYSKITHYAQNKLFRKRSTIHHVWLNHTALFLCHTFQNQTQNQSSLLTSSSSESPAEEHCLSADHINKDIWYSRTKSPTPHISAITDPSCSQLWRRDAEKTPFLEKVSLRLLKGQWADHPQNPKATHLRCVQIPQKKRSTV